MMNKIFEIIDIPVPSNGSDGKYIFHFTTPFIIMTL